MQQITETMEIGQRKVNSIVNEIGRVILGKREQVKMIVVALLSGGHVLIEDVPGVGKTTLAMALAHATGLTYKRAQFTPDVMASDITGFTMFNKEANCFEYRDGLVMCNILLADEINRTSPKTQSALLEAMEESNVTVDGTKHELPEPFMVIATQNQQGYVGTFPLPEAQLDRFMIKVTLGYPEIDEEISIISDRRKTNPLDEVKPMLSVNDVLVLKKIVKEIHLDDAIYRYITELIRQTRSHKDIALGASPRASIALMRTAQTYAYINGRTFVTPEDVAAMFPYVVSHRIMLTQEAKLHRATTDKLIDEILDSIRAPFKGKRQ